MQTQTEQMEYTSVRALVITTISLLCVTSVYMSGNRAIVYFKTQAPLSESLRATCCPLEILANLLSLKKDKIPHCCVKWSVSFHLGVTPPSSLSLNLQRDDGLQEKGSFWNMRDVIIYWLIAFWEELRDYLNDIANDTCEKTGIWIKIFEINI